MKKMRRHIIEKNGFPKPLGMLIILAALMFTCFLNLAFTQNHAPARASAVNPVNIENSHLPSES